MRPKQGFYLILSVMVLSALLGIGGYYLAHSYLENQAGSIAELKAESEIIDLKIANARSAQADLERFGFVTEIAEAVLPPEKVQSDLVAELVTFANRTNVELTRVSFQSSGEGASATSQTIPLEGINGINALPVSINIEGSYSNTLRFLEEIETNRRKMQVDSLGISPIESQNSYNTGIELYVYVRAG